MCKLRLKELRENKELNQSEVAEIINCTQTCYSKYELEQRDIPTKTLINLSNYYKVSTDYLLGKTNDPTPPNERKEPPKKEYGPATIKAAEAIRAIFREKKGREPTQEDLVILKKFIDTFIEGMKE